MICRKCGTQNDDSTKFCMGCGELLPKVHFSNRKKPFGVPRLYWIGGILLMVLIGVFVGYQLLHKTITPNAPQASQRNCVLTTSLAAGADETGKTTPAVPYVTEDSEGCLKFVGDAIHFTLNAGEAGGSALVDIGEVHKGIPLYDDGTHGDGKANNGVYECDYVISQDDIVRDAKIRGVFTTSKGEIFPVLLSPTSVTISDWQNGETSLDSVVEYAADPSTGNIYVKDRMVVGFKENTHLDVILDTLSNYHLRLSGWIPALRLYEIELSPDQSYEAIKSQLIVTEAVAGVDRNYGVENTGLPVPIPDTRMPLDQSNYLNVIRAKQGWNITKGKPDILVATSDSGVLNTHPDLQGQIASYFLCNVCTNPDDDSSVSHGTKIAGIISAELGKTGISGIAPGVRLIVFDQVCFWFLDKQICGNSLAYAESIYKATELGARVISLSFTSSDVFYLSDSIKNAYNKNVVIVAGVGEDPKQGLTFYKHQTQGDHKVYPASYEEVLAVGATETDDTVAFYSDRGDQVIYAPVPSNSGGILSTDNTGGYSISAGTSYAAPQVAALAALIISQNSNLSNKDVIEIITKTADLELTPGLGRINVYRALMVASGQPDPGFDALPKLVSNLIAIVEENDPPFVNFRWTPPNEDDYAGVHIYRKNIADESIVQLEGGLITGTNYTDQNISYGETYQYFIFSVDSRGQESVDYLVTTNYTINPPPSKMAYLRDGDIWTMNEDGSGEKQLTQLNLTRPDFIPSFYWSPDGTKIAFPYYPSPSYQNPYTISIIDADGSNRIDIANFLPSRMDYFSDISWSPDSQTIAFTNKTNEFHYDVYTVGIDGSNLINNTNNQNSGYVAYIAWSPDESRMAFTSNIKTHGYEDLYIMNLTDKSMVNVTNIPENELQNLIIHATAAFPNLISWSPNGDLLAFAGLAQGTPYCGAMGTPADCREVQNIFIATDDGKSLRNLTGPKGYDGRYDWSPDGKRIAFETNRDGNWEIYVINIDGSELINLTNNSAEDRSPSWAPDGESIVFVSNRDGNQEIYGIELESKSQIRVTNTEGNELLPSYQPAGESKSYPPTLTTSTPAPSLQDIDLTNPIDVITWFSKGLQSTDIQIFEKIFTEDTLLYGTGMATEGGRDEIAREVFLQELAMRLPNHPTCVGYTVDIENKYLMIWTQGWQPKWELLGKPFSDVLTFSLWLKNGKVSTTAYFTPDPAILGSPNIKSLPCP